VWHIAPGRTGSDYPPETIEDLAQLVVALRGVLSNESQIRDDKEAHSSSETSLGYGFRFAMPKCYRFRVKVHNTL